MVLFNSVINQEINGTVVAIAQDACASKNRMNILLCFKEGEYSNRHEAKGSELLIFKSYTIAG